MRRRHCRQCATCGARVRRVAVVEAPSASFSSLHGSAHVVVCERSRTVGLVLQKFNPIRCCGEKSGKKKEVKRESSTFLFGFARAGAVVSTCAWRCVRWSLTVLAVVEQAVFFRCGGIESFRFFMNACNQSISGDTKLQKIK